MNSTLKTHIIINPASAAGKTGRLQGKLLSVIERHIGKNHTIYVTQKTRDATSSAQQAIANGTELLIVIGGDGTINEAVNGFFAGGKLINPNCKLGIISSRTSGGLAQGLGIPNNLERQIEIIHDGRFQTIDVCKIIFQNPSGNTNQRYYVNDCQIGIGGSVVRDVLLKHKQFGGALAFGWIALTTAIRHVSKPITLQIDGKDKSTLLLHGIVAANGPYMGGGMKLAPTAIFDDGVIDVLLMHEQSILRRLINFSKVYSGSHIKSSKFSYHHCCSIELTSPEDVPFAVDGELIGVLPCRIEIIPKTLRICSPPSVS